MGCASHSPRGLDHDIHTLQYCEGIWGDWRGALNTRGWVARLGQPKPAIQSARASLPQDNIGEVKCTIRSSASGCSPAQE
jgi:hypothetical protein